MQKQQREQPKEKTVKAEIVIDGQPVGKGRPKFARQGNYVRTYTPEKTKEYEELIQTIWQLKAKDSNYHTVFFPAGTPVSVMITAYYKIPNGTNKAKKAEMLTGKIRPLVKPDFDNVVKAVCDALNGTAYDDDKQIVEARVMKFYSDNPRVEIAISDI